MKFKKVLESPIIKNHTGIMQREAVRAIICTNNKILLARSDRGDYKFPGGGVEENESYSEALVREVREETGYINCIVKGLMGVVIERKMDEFVNGHVFEMTSHYYPCELTNVETISQELDEYESIFKFTPQWVGIEDAIKQNESLITRFENNSWLKRETFVLKELKEYVG
ncbi:NUDIX hydrolase [Sporosarcina sp. YIM B06819]|uniref:NUDIX hydrolase n=1 Tax=Sporosarcina sp. YIM B06819 TaxID=3081769 RepID=UPI00298C0CC5|nr:NUDIX domain-containing protein [Sporosarcina sp. YIM B06819]